MKVSHFLLLMFFFLISIRSDGPSPTGSRPTDSRSRHGDGEHLLARGFRRRIEEPSCSSGYHRTNTEANDRMWVFHSGIYATQLWRYVASFFERNGSELKIAQSVIVHPFSDVNDQIAAFCAAFTDLRKDFDSRLSLSM